MPITLPAQNYSIITYQNRIDSRAPNGALLGAANVAPVWSPTTPTVLTFTTGGAQQVNWAQYASDANGDTLTYSLPLTRAGITINAATGLMTVNAPGTSGNVTVRVSDGTLYADHAVAINALAAPPAAAFYLIPVSASARTLNATSATGFAGGQWQTTGGQIRLPQPGDVIELAPGTHGSIDFRNFKGSAGNPIIVRNTYGQVSTIQGSSFPFTPRSNEYLTFDGSNGMAAWSPYDSTAEHGIRVRGTNPSTMPTSYLKHFGFQKGLRYIRVEIDGRKALQGNGMLAVTGSDVGIMINDQGATMRRDLTANNGKWQNDDIEFYECYVHHCGSEGGYLGINYNAMGCPSRDVRVVRSRFEQIGSGGCQMKTLWGGENNGFSDCVVLYTGNDFEVHEYETGHGHGLQFVGQGHVRNCWVEQSREAGVKVYWDDGPNPVADASSPTGYSEIVPRTDGSGSNKWPVRAIYDVEIANNVILRAGGTPCLTLVAGAPQISGTPPTNMTLAAHGITIGTNAAVRVRPRIVSNTILDSVGNGIQLGNVADGGIVANNIVLGSGASAIAGASGQDVRGNVTTGSPSSLFVAYVTSPDRNVDNGYDLHLQSAQPATGTRGTHFTATDIAGANRGTGGSGTSAPDVGAYEYTG